MIILYFLGVFVTFSVLMFLVAKYAKKHDDTVDLSDPHELWAVGGFVAMISLIWMALIPLCIGVFVLYKWSQMIIKYAEKSKED